MGLDSNLPHRERSKIIINHMQHTINLSEEQESAIQFISAREGLSVEYKIELLINQVINNVIGEYKEAQFKAFLNADSSKTKAEIETELKSETSITPIINEERI